MKIGITCYPTFGGSGVIATEIGLELARRDHQVHFICYDIPRRLKEFTDNVFFHEVEVREYPFCLLYTSNTSTVSSTRAHIAW